MALGWWPGRELNPRHADFQSQPSRADPAIFNTQAVIFAKLAPKLIRRSVIPVLEHISQHITEPAGHPT
jgi:hypothetical protein